MSGAAARSAPTSRRAWGWHRLTDPWASRIVDVPALHPGELVVDLGAGTGALVGPLLSHGVRVLAVELHPGRAQTLRDRWPQERTERRLVVVEADLLDFRFPTRPFRVVANPPYAIASAVLARLLAPGSRLESAHLALPKPVARRWVSGAPRGAGRWMREYQLSIGMPIPRDAFVPWPRTDSVLLVVTRRR